MVVRSLERRASKTQVRFAAGPRMESTNGSPKTENSMSDEKGNDPPPSGQSIERFASKRPPAAFRLADPNHPFDLNGHSFK
jgi:hypothetical protein